MVKDPMREKSEMYMEPDLLASLISEALKDGWELVSRKNPAHGRYALEMRRRGQRNNKYWNPQSISVMIPLDALLKWKQHCLVSQNPLTVKEKAWLDAGETGIAVKCLRERKNMSLQQALEYVAAYKVVTADIGRPGGRYGPLDEEETITLEG